MFLIQPLKKIIVLAELIVKYLYYLHPKTRSIVDKSQKNKKALLDIDYDEVKEEKDFAKFFKPSKSLTLTKSTLSKYSKVKNTLAAERSPLRC